MKVLDNKLKNNNQKPANNFQRKWVSETVPKIKMGINKNKRKVTLYICEWITWMGCPNSNIVYNYDFLIRNQITFI